MSQSFRTEIGTGQRPEIPRVRFSSRQQQTDVEVWSRAEFLEYFGTEYGPGQHVTFIGPTQKGKTQLSQEMLQVVVSPQLPCLILAGKPPGRDVRMAQAAEMLHLQITETWPPSPVAHARRLLRKQSDAPFNGWVLRPKQEMDDLNADNEQLKAQFKRALMEAYAGKYGKIIVVADETKLIYDLELKAQHEAILTRGAPEIGIWSLLQRGRFVTLYAYDMPEHLLFFHDPDAANTRRYAEMVGGVNPRHLVDTMNSLQLRPIVKDDIKVTISEAIYFRRSESRLIIVKMD